MTRRGSPAHRAEIAIAVRDAAIDALADLVAAFGRELDRGYSTSAQQSALRSARALLAEHGRGGR